MEQQVEKQSAELQGQLRIAFSPPGHGGLYFNRTTGEIQ
jgi:hypothetical protein